MNHHYSHGFYNELTDKEKRSDKKAKLKHEDFNKRFKKFQREKGHRFEVVESVESEKTPGTFQDFLVDKNNPKNKLVRWRNEKRVLTMYDPDDEYLENNCDDKGRKIINRWWLGKTDEEIAKIKRESRASKRLDDELNKPSANEYKSKQRNRNKKSNN